jgi:hypothetical protein
MEDLPSHGDRQQVVARLSAESRATPGGEVELSLDTSQIHLFAADSGRSLTATAACARRRRPPRGAPRARNPRADC